jgi:hypothetical protein
VSLWFRSPHLRFLAISLAASSACEMALSALAYNLTRVMNIVGIKPLIAAIVARAVGTRDRGSTSSPARAFLHTAKTRC